MSDREKVYDEQIAPLLREAAKVAIEHDIPFFAVAEMDDVLGRTTASLPVRQNMSAQLLLILMAEQARGNIDTLIIQALRDARDYGHSSALLSLLDREVRHE